MRSIASRAALVLIACALGAGACKKKSDLTDATDRKFKVGQRWSYWARPGEEQSTFTICKIESHPTAGVIVHVGLDNLHIQAGKASTGLLPHLAFSRDAIDKSAAKMIEEDAPLPNYKKGYDEWKAAADDGKLQVWSSTVADTIDSIEKTLNEPPPPPK
jgi:hypothetical protein